jgi:leucyl-tRNA synthetase
MFPYPSGAGLHVGHPEGYTATDILCRYKRMNGFNVLHPMGWDAFGLPAEQYAVQTGVHPATTTRKAIDTFRRQLQRFGFSYDWSRELATIDEGYYRWTQWIFLRLYNAWYDAEAPARDGSSARGRARPIADLIAELESGAMGVNLVDEPVRLGERAVTLGLGGTPAGVRLWHQLSQPERRRFIDNQRLAYLDEVTVNWCPKLGTSLANEEVIDGKSERGGFPVLRKPLKQWMFRITAYADRLLAGLARVDWPESTKTLQAEWIGRSEGAQVDFPLDPAAGLSNFGALTVYTTRPDTIFGATYMVVAPEHDLVKAALGAPASAAHAAELRRYVEWARNRSDVERMESKEKTGAFTGVHAINPATGEQIPVWTADYVLMGYGTGAIMAVPAHDDRDYEFAKAFNLPIRDVIYPRIVLAMRYYAQHAVDLEPRAEAWTDGLADFLGMVTSQNATPDQFPTAFQRLQKRRAHGPEAEELEAVFEAQTGPPGARGATRAVWLETIEDLRLDSAHDLRQRFERAGFYAAEGAAFTGEGTAVNSANAQVSLDGLTVTAAKERIVEWLSSQGLGSRSVNFKLRDWVFSRQRYWGEPFPVVYDATGRHYPVAESALPVRLPPLADFQPVESNDPRPLLAKATDWVTTTAGAAGVDPALLDPSTPVTRETNTMPNWAGSCWYFLRFCDPHNTERFVSPEAERYWMGPGSGPGPGGAGGGIDLYVGGAEHAVLHLLYARFWHAVLFDLGEVSSPEPFARLFHQGLITSFSYQRPDKSLVPTDQVETREQPDGSVRYYERATGQELAQVIAKMSKSLKNVVNPDDVIAEFGADTFRLYEMYMGPLEASKPWNPRDIAGCFRFVQRAWRLCVDERTGALRASPGPEDPALERLLHRTIAKVGADIERLAFNTAIAAMIEFVNAATSAANAKDAGGSGAGAPILTLGQIERFACTLAPFIPHVAEELWALVGRARTDGPQRGFVSLARWPGVDPAMLQDDAVEIPVQILGKVRHKISVPPKSDAAAIEAAARADDKVRQLLADKPVKKVIVVPGKLINFVTG